MFGQFDPSTGIIADIQMGPEQGYDPATGYMVLADGSRVYVGTPQEAVSQGPPSIIPYQGSTVPKPPTTPITSTSPYAGTTVSAPTSCQNWVQDTPGGALRCAGLAPGPAPRVNVPLSASDPSSIAMWLGNSTLMSGIPNWLTLGGGALLLSVLAGAVGGGRRRR